jgi:hypothetical protein
MNARGAEPEPRDFARRFHVLWGVHSPKPPRFENGHDLSAPSYRRIAASPHRRGARRGFFDQHGASRSRSIRDRASTLRPARASRTRGGLHGSRVDVDRIALIPLRRRRGLSCFDRCPGFHRSVLFTGRCRSDRFRLSSAPWPASLL